MRQRFGTSILIALATLVTLPVAASAQSVIAGQVRDESGGVLPGVTVEAASPVLIEKVRTVISDGQGQYRFVDLRPGTYRVTFALAGFGTLVRDGVELPANLVVTVNGSLTVGALQETVTVSGASPTVDIQQASTIQVLSQDLLNALPSTHNIMSYGQLVVGIKTLVPDVGGAKQVTQTYMRSHGAGETSMTFYVDSLQTNANEQNLRGQNYMTDAFVAEVSLTTSAQPAETSAGGVRVNYIPKDGGNRFSGSVFLSRVEGKWQSDNINEALRKRGLRSPNTIEHISNFTGSLGGPIWRDKLWFFAAMGHDSVDERIPNYPNQVVLKDGTTLDPVFAQWMEIPLARLTYQMTPKNKISVFLQRTLKYSPREGSAFGIDPVGGTTNRDGIRGQMYGIGHAKWTSTVSSRLLLDAGFAFSTLGQTALYQDGIEQPKYLSNGQVNPAWLANAPRTDTALNINPSCQLPTGCTAWGAPVRARRSQTARNVIAASATYVTGSHSLKTGFQWAFGENVWTQHQQADLVQNYVNGRPQTVTVFNTPLRIPTWMARDLGVYVQDAWKIRRLTLNMGLRLEYFNSGMDETTMEAGRFVPARFFAAQRDMPNWKHDPAPRLSAAYDLFGDGKTALKASASKYYAPFTATMPFLYADAAILQENRNWFDSDLIPGTATRSGLSLPTNGDDIAQDNEIGPSGSAAFGRRPDRNYDPNLKRYYNWEYSAGIQRELFAGVSANFAYFRRTYGDLVVMDRTQISRSDYTSFQLPIPNFSNDPTLAGVLDPKEVLTIYNLNPAKRGVFNTGLFDRQSTSDQSIYNGFETSFSARVRQGVLLYGGWTIERHLTAFCDMIDSPNGTFVDDLSSESIAAAVAERSVAVGGRFCDERNFDVPWRSDFKLVGSYPLPYGLGVAAALQSIAGVPRRITWTPAASLFPGGRTNSETIVLTKPGSLFQPRLNVLDVNIRKQFRRGRTVFTGQVDVFNVLNASTILTTNNVIGSSLGQVTAVLQGRMPRLVFQMEW